MSETVLVVCAHPDDEVLGCGGTIARLVGEGHKVDVLVFTDGVGARMVGSRVLDNSEEDRRSQEFFQALTVLGVTCGHQRNFPDNALDTVPLLDLVQKVEKLIDALKPSTVYTHHAGDLNIDHQLIARAAVT